MKKKTVVLIVLDIMAIFCLLLAYGPNEKFKDMFITTAMSTKSHQYLARVLYSEKQIEEVLKKNYTEDFKDETKPADITFKPSNEKVYENEYEEQILNHEEGQLYKLIEFDEKNYHVYLTVIYDASRIKTMKSSFYGTNGEYLSKMANKNGAIVAINGGGFTDVGGMGNGAKAADIFIKDGEIIENHGGKPENIIGFNNNNVLILGRMTAQEAIEKGIRDAVCFGPYLIMNGKKANLVGNGGYGTHPRTAIGQRKDGIVLLLTVEGNGSKYGFRGGATMQDLVNIFERYNAYNASNLDGGASSVLYINGEVVNDPVAYSSSGERSLPNGWIIK